MSEVTQKVEHNLKIRADQSEQLLKDLWKEFDDLSKLFSEKHSQALADRLRNENKMLMEDIEVKRSELISLEQQHKVPQVLSSLLCDNLAVKKNIGHCVVPNASAESSTKVEKEKNKPQKKLAKQTKAGSEPGNPSAPVDVTRLDFRVGRIISAKKHPDADALYIEDVDVGEGKLRTVISGLVKSVPLDEMQNRMAVLLCNLKPVKMRGVTSEAMVMCGVTPEKTEILNPPEGAVPGDLVEFEGYQRNPDAVLNAKHKVFETVQPDLKVDSNGTATYKGTPWTVPGKGMVVAPTLKNAIIK